MTDVKRDFDDDDVDLKDIGDKDIGADSGSDAEDGPDEAMEMCPVDPSTNLLPELWLAKIPKSLMEKWEKVQQGGVKLATLEIFALEDGQENHQIVVKLDEPPPRDPDALPGQPGSEPLYDLSDESKKFRFNVPMKKVENRYIFADQPKVAETGEPAPKRARLSKLVGKVAHRGTFVPVLDATYESKVQKRHAKAHEKTRTTIRIGDKLPGGGKYAGGQALTDPDALKSGKSNFKMLTSGVNRGGTSLNLSKKVTKEPQDKYFRIARNELLDQLMGLFRKRDAWTFKELREITEQPVEYLKETLGMIAEMKRGGPNNNMWVLNATQKATLEQDPTYEGPEVVKQDPGVKPESGSLAGDDDDEGMDDDDDDDMEEI